MTHTFRARVEGLTHKNPNGTNRQKILSKCKVGEPLNLVREPDDPKDEFAVAVFRLSGEKLGYLSELVVQGSQTMTGLAEYMDNGHHCTAEIAELTGGAFGFWDLIFKSRRKSRDCVIEITIESTPYQIKEMEANDLIKRGKSQEKTDPDNSLLLYQRAMTLLQEADGLCAGMSKDGKILRRVRHPIDRVTLLLEKEEKYEECLKQIEKYEAAKDPVGLTAGDAESLSKRKARVLKKLS
jgi:hypothetical protein